MKQQLRSVTSLLMSLLLASLMWAQDESPARDQPGADEVAAARRVYTQSEVNSQSANSSPANDRPATDGTALVQLPRRSPRMPHPRQSPRPRRSYPVMWRETDNGRGAAIGALIGAGLGVGTAIAVNHDNRTKAYVGASLVFGGLGALVGAVAGRSWPSRNWRNHRPWRDEPDLASNSDRAKPRNEPAQILESQEPSTPPAASQTRTLRDTHGN